MCYFPLNLNDCILHFDMITHIVLCFAFIISSCKMPGSSSGLGIVKWTGCTLGAIDENSGKYRYVWCLDPWTFRMTTWSSTRDLNCSCLLGFTGLPST